MEGSFTICREILAHHDLSSTDKIVGVVLGMAIVKDRDFARVKLGTIMERASLSERTVQSAVKSLEHSGILHRVRTGRAAIYRFSLLQQVKSSKIVEAENSAGQRRKILRVTGTPRVTPTTPQGQFKAVIGEDFVSEE